MSSSILDFDHKFYIRFLLILIALIFLSIFAFNKFIEPYGDAYFKVDGINLKPIVRASAKDRIDYISKKSSVNAFVIGSSQASNLCASYLNEKSSYSYINYALSLSMSSEHYYYIEYFMQNLSFEKILYGIDIFNLLGTYTYRGDTLNKDVESIILQDYLTLNTILQSIKKIEFNQKSYKDNEVKDNIKDDLDCWSKKSINKDELDKQLNDIRPIKKAVVSKREFEYFSKISQKYKNNITPFITLYHPYFIYMQRKDNHISIIKKVLELYESVYMVNPKYLSFLMKSENYIDAGHMNTDIGNMVIDGIFGNSDFMIKVDKSSYISTIDSYYDFICKQDFSSYNYSSFVDDCKVY